MARPKNDVPSEEIKITVHPVVRQYLRALIPRGVYGRSEAEIAGRWVEERIQVLIEGGSLTVIDGQPPAAKT